MHELTTWTVYKRPPDHPRKFVARCWVGATQTDSVVLADDLAEMRQILQTELGLIPTPRQPEDAPEVVEVWI